MTKTCPNCGTQWEQNTRGNHKYCEECRSQPGHHNVARQLQRRKWTRVKDVTPSLKCLGEPIDCTDCLYAIGDDRCKIFRDRAAIADRCPILAGVR